MFSVGTDKVLLETREFNTNIERTLKENTVDFTYENYHFHIECLHDSYILFEDYISVTEICSDS